MVERFINDRPYPIWIPRFGVYAAPGATFEVPDEDAGSLNDDFPFVGGDPSVAYDTDGTPYFTGGPGDLAADSDGTPYVASTLAAIAVDTDGVYYLAA